MRYRKRFWAMCMAIIVAATVSACGASGGNTSEQNQTEGKEESATGSADENTLESAATDSADEVQKADTADVSSDGGSILIAYFTAGENSGVDADASASYSVVDGEAKGRLRAIADMIQENTGGELFSIQTDVVYSADINELINYAQEEQNDDARPKLTSQIENFDSYDTVFVGVPTWWYDMPQAMYSFFDQYDFSGKTIIPFNVHNGSRFSGTIETIQELEPDAAVVTDGYTVSERDVPDAAGDVADWISGLSYGHQ